MQLKEPTSLRAALGLATCTLLSGTAAAQSSGDWKVDSSLLYYEEADRVTVVEPVVFATRRKSEDESVTVRAVFDSLTGASPNGAVPTDGVQTFTGASGTNTYTTPAGELPKRDFSDTRVAFGVDWDKRTGSNLRRTLSGNLSREEDYFSLGGNAVWSLDVNRKLTTLAAGIGLALDTVQPSGGAPTGLRRLSDVVAQANTATGGEDGEEHEGLEGERKQTMDVLLGVTQVVSRRTLVQLNYSHSFSDGYLNDPYKVVSLVHPDTGATVDYVFEKRPGTRNADILYGKLVHSFDRDVLHLAYRHFNDDWGIRADTADLQYRWHFGADSYLEPQYRYHRQEAADFFHHFLVDGQAVDYASADLRLAAFTATTVGLKAGTRLDKGEISLRLAQMVQQGEGHPSEAYGVLRSQDLHPELTATLVNLNYSVDW